MPQFRLTQRYAKDCRVEKLVEPNPMTHILDDWFIDVIRIQRKKVAMVVHAKSLFTFLLPYAEIGCAVNVPACIGVLLQEFLQKNDLMDRHEQVIKLFRDPMVFCKTNDRRVLGHMNDFKRYVESFLEHQERPTYPINLRQLAKEINQIPINFGAAGYAEPLEQFLRILGDLSE